ncbi:MAG: DUF2059 domain-containing protein, partial [Moraxella sp.]|nr:DUF2059 domain-containing protein [Moraxella sp.]
TLIVGALPISPVFAKTPSDASMDRLAVVGKIDELFKDGVKTGFTSTVSANTRQKLRDAGVELNNKQRNAFNQAVDKFGDKVTDDIVSPALLKTIRQEFKKTAKQYYSQAEVDAMIEFYSTPVGRSIVGKQSAVTEHVTQSTMAILENNKVYQDGFNKAIEKHMPDFDKEIEAIIK